MLQRAARTAPDRRDFSTEFAVEFAELQRVGWQPRTAECRQVIMR